jgi:endonuclease III
VIQSLELRRRHRARHDAGQRARQRMTALTASFVAPVARNISIHLSRRAATAAAASMSPKRTPPAPPPPSNADLPRMRAKAARISTALTAAYPVAPVGFLDHRDAYTLLVAVVLSAQTTDVKVNQVTPALFDAADTPAKMIALGQERVLELVRTVGLAPGKSKNIVGLSEQLVERHAGAVPRTFEELEGLPGVGHKTASVVMMQAFKIPAFPVDTHVHRLACRWGCGDSKSVEKTEAVLKQWFDDESAWGDLHTRIILFGREYCPARNHDMDACPVCSFAATAEARRLNLSSSNKFVGAPAHKDPYSIRDPTGADCVEGAGVDDEERCAGDAGAGARARKDVAAKVATAAGKRTTRAGGGEVGAGSAAPAAPPLKRVTRRSTKI